MEITGTLVASNNLDTEGRPAGGHASGVGFTIDWQDGPLGRGDDRKMPNGAFIGDILLALLQRLDFYQTTDSGKFACHENAVAIEHLKTALLWLQKRTADREARLVEGTHTA